MREAQGGVGGACVGVGVGTWWWGCGQAGVGLERHPACPRQARGEEEVQRYWNRRMRAAASLRAIRQAALRCEPLDVEQGPQAAAP